MECTSFFYYVPYLYIQQFLGKYVTCMKGGSSAGLSRLFIFKEFELWPEWRQISDLAVVALVNFPIKFFEFFPWHKEKNLNKNIQPQTRRTCSLVKFFSELRRYGVIKGSPGFSDDINP